MTQEAIIDIGAMSILTAIKVAAPALLTIMLTGLLVSIFQAATQINEQTLSFIPKVLAMSGVIIMTGPWVMQTVLTFTRMIFERIPFVTQ